MSSFSSSLNTSMGLLFLSFFLLIAVSVGATAWVIETQKVDALIINLAGRQRMLIQRMTREAALIESGADEGARRSLLESVNTFQRTLNALVNGGVAPYLPDQAISLPATQDGAIRAQLDQVGASWSTFKRHLMQLYAVDENGPSPAASLEAVERLSPTLLSQMDSVVRMYEAASSEKVERLRWIQRTFFLSAIGLLAAGFVLTRKSVVSPLAALARAAEKIGGGDLRTELQVAGASEIQALAGSLEAMRSQLMRSREELEDRVQKRTRELAALHEVSREISSRLEIDHVLRSVTDKARELLNCETAFICLLDDTDTFLRLKAMSGPKAALGELRIQVQDPHAELVLGGKAAVLCNGVGCSSTCRIIAEPHHRSHLAASLRVGERVIGALCAASPDLGVFDQEDANVLTKLADSAAVALENARLYRQAERAATLEERHRIAAEIHDGLAQILSYLELEVEDLIERIDTHRPEVLRGELLAIREAVSQAGREARTSIARLHEETPRPVSLQERIENVVREYSGTCRFEITYQGTDLDSLRLPPPDISHVLRILQEALNNAHRHARSKRVAITLQEEDQHTILTIEDDGVGFNIDAPPQDDRPHFGLSIMKARAKRLDGDLEIKSSPGEGTRIVLTWPIPRPKPLDLTEGVRG